MLKQFLEAGRIVGTHGVHGELRVNPWCDSSAFLRQFHTFYLGVGKVPMKVCSMRIQKKQLLVVFQGVDSVEKADTLRSRILYFKRDDAKIAKGRYFIDDLMGLEDVYQITAPDKKDYLIPAVEEVIRDINLEKGKMLIRPVKGIFDDED